MEETDFPENWTQRLYDGFTRLKIDEANKLRTGVFSRDQQMPVNTTITQIINKKIKGIWPILGIYVDGEFLIHLIFLNLYCPATDTISYICNR